MNDKVEFLPFNAINEFMLSEYRRDVFKLVFNNFASLTNSRQKAINSLVKKNVSIQGFRDSSLAPAPFKIKNCAPLFEKSANFSAEILAAWFELNTELAEQVNQLLINKGWVVLPIEADRSKLPGFLVKWPAEVTFENLTGEFHSLFPQSPFTDDDISLMVVWLSNRLPYQMVTDDLFKKE
jgi:hypothetical protein